MNDLLKKLRDNELLFQLSADGMDWSPDLSLFGEAADELERLTAELRATHAAIAWVPVSERHHLHAIRRARHLRVVESHTTVPADLEADVPPVPAWMQPVPRRSRDSYCTPLIQHNSTGNKAREFVSIYRLYRRSHGVLYSLRMARNIALRGFPF